jgi:hypothetical protein
LGDGGADGGDFNSDNSSKKGLNMLGRILMEIRTLLSNSYPKPPDKFSNWLIPHFVL